MRNAVTTCKSAQSFPNVYASKGLGRKGDKECALQARDTSLDTGYYVLNALAHYVKIPNVDISHTLRAIYPNLENIFKGIVMIKVNLVLVTLEQIQSFKQLLNYDKCF